MEDSMRIDKLAVAVTFFYKEEKIAFLSQTLSNIHLFSKDTHIYIITNTSDKKDHSVIEKCFHAHSTIQYSILVPTLLGHPYFLAWSHKDIFRHLVETDPAITHYLYLEDDILLTQSNIEYYLEGESRLRETRFLPSFVRYETDANGTKYAIDIMRQSLFRSMSMVQYSDTYFYIDFPYLYQGIYLLNAKYMKECFDDHADNPDYLNFWQTRERSTAVLFHKVPEGFKSRNLVGYMYHDGQIALDSRCLIHHLPNNYVANKEFLAKVYTVDNILVP